MELAVAEGLRTDSASDSSVYVFYCVCLDWKPVLNKSDKPTLTPEKNIGKISFLYIGSTHYSKIIFLLQS